MTLCIKQNVFRLQVSVYDIFIVKSFNSADNLCCVQFCALLREPLLFSQISKEFTAIQKVDEEVEFAISLECVMQANDVRVLDLLKNVSLSCIYKALEISNELWTYPEF